MAFQDYPGYRVERDDRLVLELSWQFGTRIFQGKRGKKKKNGAGELDDLLLTRICIANSSAKGDLGVRVPFLFFIRGVQDGLCPDYIPKGKKRSSIANPTTLGPGPNLYICRVIETRVRVEPLTLPAGRIGNPGSR